MGEFSFLFPSPPPSLVNVNSPHIKFKSGNLHPSLVCGLHKFPPIIHASATKCFKSLNLSLCVWFILSKEVICLEESAGFFKVLGKPEICRGRFLDVSFPASCDKQFDAPIITTIPGLPHALSSPCVWHSRCMSESPGSQISNSASTEDTRSSSGVPPSALSTALQYPQYGSAILLSCWPRAQPCPAFPFWVRNSTFLKAS